MIRYQQHIIRQDLRDNPQWLYVFGDNMTRLGLGGQAARMRGEPNAVGIPTKRRPSMAEEAFFTDRDLHPFIIASRDDIKRLRAHSGTIVWPMAGIGTGRAQLERRAPKIWVVIEELRFELEGDENVNIY